MNSDIPVASVPSFVGGLVEEGRVGKVKENRVVMDALHALGRVGVAPLDFVERRLGRCCGHRLSLKDPGDEGTLGPKTE